MGARTTCWSVLGLMGLGICGVGMSQSAALPDQPVTDRWEYRVVEPRSTLNDSTLASHLNQSGNAGWEVIGIRDRALILKRAKR